MGWGAAVGALLIAALAAAVSLWVSAWFRHRWDHAGPIAQRAGRGSYAAYLIHALVLVTLSLAFVASALPPEAAFGCVTIVGVPATFAVGYDLTRIPGVRRIL